MATITQLPAVAIWRFGTYFCEFYEPRKNLLSSLLQHQQDYLGPHFAQQRIGGGAGAGRSSNGNGGPSSASSRRNNYAPRSGRECKFCKNNGESREQYTSHVLRHPSTHILICPVLRSHVCEECGATGDAAHTRNYCPKLKKEKKMQLAIPVTLKKTKRQSDGQMRH